MSQHEEEEISGAAGRTAADLDSDNLNGAMDAEGSQSSGRRRHRGGRGVGEKRWRGGPPPMPPELRGTMQHIQGKHFRLWLQRVERWRFLAKEYYPETEQATRLLEHIYDDPAEELQVITDTKGNKYWTCPDGVDLIIGVLKKEYDEDQMIYRARVLGEYEHVKRKQGEGLQEYVVRFKRTVLQRKLVGKQDLDSEDLAYKLLTTASVDPKTKQNILTSSGHVWDFDRICSSIKVLFPRPTDYRDLTQRPGHERTAQSPAEKGRSTRPFVKKVHATESSPPAEQSNDSAEQEEPAEVEVAEQEEGAEDQYTEPEDAEEATHEYEVAQEAFTKAQETLTVTSRKLKNVTQGRGFTKKPAELPEMPPRAVARALRKAAEGVPEPFQKPAKIPSSRSSRSTHAACA